MGGYIGSSNFTFYEKQTDKKINDLKNTIDNDISKSIKEINEKKASIKYVDENIQTIESNLDTIRQNLPKLYSETGNNEDGAMTQAAVTNLVGDIGSILDEINRTEV